MEPKDYSHLFSEMPCKEAVEWLRSQTSIHDAWNNCHRGDWLWWALRHSKNKNALPYKSLSVKFAKWCTERDKYYVTDAVTYVATFAANADAAAAVYAADAADAERLEQANWIREYVKYPFG